MARDLFEVVGGTPALAARHGLSALVADELSSLGRPIPSELAQDAREQIARGLKTRALTRQVLDTLAPLHVVPVVLKGYALAQRLYPRQPLARASVDLDLLVTHRELPACVAALEGLGLRRFVDTSLGDVFEDHHHLAFLGPPGLVELHFRLFQGFGSDGFDDEALLARARSAALDGRPMRLLAPEDEFLYLATHAANHGFLRLSWLVDLDRYLGQEPALDWALVAARARRAGVSVAVAATLRVLERLLGTALPPLARRHFPSTRVRDLVDAIVLSDRKVLSARLSDHRLGSFLLRLWLCEWPTRGMRSLLDGVLRASRRRAARRADGKLG